MSARIVNYLYNLPRNGYNETVALLNYHYNEYESTRDKNQIYLFFEHYYNNQWLDHDHKPDERMLSVKMQDNKVVGVYGKEYLRSGHLRYEGLYYKKLYHGQGRLFMPNQDCYSGVFENGKKEGRFSLYNERLLLRQENYLDGKLQGETLEFFNDGKIRSRYNYVGGNKEGEAEIRNGKGGLIFKGTYRHNMLSGTAYEFLGPNVAYLCNYNTEEKTIQDLVYIPLRCLDSPFKPDYDVQYYQLQKVISIRNDCQSIFKKRENEQKLVRICRGRERS